MLTPVTGVLTRRKDEYGVTQEEDLGKTEAE